jgi:hypothetical protein
MFQRVLFTAVIVGFVLVDALAVYKISAMAESAGATSATIVLTGD